MDTNRIIEVIEQEIARLSQARALLLDGTAAVKRAGRPKGPHPIKKRKGGMTTEGRKRIADAMKKRWADRKAAESSKASGATKAPTKAVTKK